MKRVIAVVVELADNSSVKMSRSKLCSEFNVRKASRGGHKLFREQLGEAALEKARQMGWQPVGYTFVERKPTRVKRKWVKRSKDPKAESARQKSQVKRMSRGYTKHDSSRLSKLGHSRAHR